MPEDTVSTPHVPDQITDGEAMLTIIAIQRALLDDLPPEMDLDEFLGRVMRAYGQHGQQLLDAALWLGHRLLRSIDELDGPLSGLGVLMAIQHDTFGANE